MSKLNLDVNCPYCESEDILIVYDGESGKIMCHCLDCSFAEELNEFSYLIIDYEFGDEW